MKASKARSHSYAGDSPKLDPPCSQEYFPDSGPWLPGLPELLVIESRQLLAKPPDEIHRNEASYLYLPVGVHVLHQPNVCKDVRKRDAPQNPFMSAPLDSLHAVQITTNIA